MSRGYPVGTLDAGSYEYRFVKVMECQSCGFQKERYKRPVYRPTYCDECGGIMETRKLRTADFEREYKLTDEILEDR